MVKLLHERHFRDLFIVFLVGALTCVTVYSLIPMKRSLAQGGIPFGGQVASVGGVCCDGSIPVTLDVDLSSTPGIPPIFLYDPRFTTVYEYGQVTKPGAWLLGLRTGPDICWTGKFCSNSLPVAGRMIIVGTSY